MKKYIILLLVFLFLIACQPKITMYEELENGTITDYQDCMDKAEANEQGLIDCYVNPFSDGLNCIKDPNQKGCTLKRFGEQAEVEKDCRYKKGYEGMLYTISCEDLVIVEI